MDHKLTFWCVSYYSGAFRTLLVALQYSIQNGSNWCNSSCHKVVLEFFAMNAPHPPHWTLNSCFRAFCTIWVHLGLFGCLPILSAKRVKLVQKFVPRSRVGIFRNERTQFTPLEPKLMFWSVFYYLGAFATVWLPFKIRCKTGKNWSKSSCHEVPSEFFATKAPDLTH